jgi:hypothetical protein
MTWPDLARDTYGVPASGEHAEDGGRPTEGPALRGNISKSLCLTSGWMLVNYLATRNSLPGSGQQQL